MTMDKIILDGYKQYNYPSANVLYKLLDAKKKNITLKNIQDVINKQKSYQLHKKVKNKVSSHLVAFRSNQIILADLIDMSTYETTNKYYKWILVIMDVFDRTHMH
jgi:hypothetical protein